MTGAKPLQVQFPPGVIRYAVWLNYPFTLSLRDVEDLLAERRVDVSYETVRCWPNKLARRSPPTSARAVPKPTAYGVPDEMVVRGSCQTKIAEGGCKR